jgi:hypothetical protein
MSLRSEFLSLLAAVTMATAGCQAQGEGDLCNLSAGNDGDNDCQSGLRCQPEPGLVLAGYGLCCPSNGQATTTACAVPGNSLDASPVPPPAQTDAFTPPEAAAEDGPTTESEDAASASDDAADTGAENTGADAAGTGAADATAE